MGLNLVLLAGGTTLYIVGDPLVYFGPLIEFLDFSNCFIPSGMSGSRVIVGFS